MHRECTRIKQEDSLLSFHSSALLLWSLLALPLNADELIEALKVAVRQFRCFFRLTLVS